MNTAVFMMEVKGQRLITKTMILLILYDSNNVVAFSFFKGQNIDGNLPATSTRNSVLW